MDVNNSTQANETFTFSRLHLIPGHTMITLYSILLVWSLLGNVLVITVVYYNQNLRTNMNYLIVNMAVSDLLIPLVAMPRFISLVKTDGEWLVDGHLGAALCKLLPFLSVISPFVSSINLAIIAFHRFMAVVYPTRQQIFRGRKSRWFVISFPWIVAMALFSPFFYTYRLTKEWGYMACVYSWSPAAFDYWTAEKILVSIHTAVGFVIPVIVIITLYAIIVYKLRKSLNNVMDMIEEETIRSRQRRNRRIFSMLITIVVMFIICWCPFQGWYLLYLHPIMRSIDSDTYYKMRFVFWYMWYLLSAINPCIYFVFLRDFRQGLKSLCCRKTASAIEPIARQPRPPGGDSNQNPAHRTPHINTTSV